MAHVGEMGGGAGEVAVEEGEHGRAAVDAGEGVAAAEEVGGEGLAGAAADVEDFGGGREEGAEAVQPGGFDEVGAAEGGPGGAVALVGF